MVDAVHFDNLHAMAVNRENVVRVLNDILLNGWTLESAGSNTDAGHGNETEAIAFTLLNTNDG